MKKVTTVAALAAGILAPSTAVAVEGGTGAYLLGSRGVAAGFVPAPGVYVTDTVVYLNGGTKSDLATVGGAIVADPSYEAWLNLFSVTLIPEGDFLGGSAGISVVVPYSSVNMDFDARFLGGPLEASDSQTGFGDLAVTPLIGWHDGHWNYSLSASIYLPTGEYSPSVVKPPRGVYDVLNIGKNKAAIDPTFSVTWLNPNIGLEVSGALGVTFSSKNQTTDYQTAPELHFETAIAQRFRNGAVIGLAGYAYQQLGNDSGSGAKALEAALGAKSLQARVFGIGPVVGYQTMIAGTSVNLQAKYLHEFAAKRRLQSESFWFTASLGF